MFIRSSRKTVPVTVKTIMVLLIVVFAATFIFAVRNSQKVPLQFKQPEPGKVPSPLFSRQSGFYDAPFHVNLSHPDPKVTIYFSLDGSDPTWQSSSYREPLMVSPDPMLINRLSHIPSSPRWKIPAGTGPSFTVIKAIAVLPDSSVSEAVTYSFFVFGNSRNHFTLPVISLVTDPANLFDYSKGIYALGKQYDDKETFVRENVSTESMWWFYPANYRLRGQSGERPVYIQFFNEKGNLQFESQAGLRIHGEASRAYSRKSLRLHFRKKYGLPSLNYRLFPDDTLTNFRSVVLRNSGNDWDKSLIRDVLAHSLAKNTDLGCKQYQPVIVYMNGEYWGIHFLSTYMDDSHQEIEHNLEPGSVLMVEGSGKLYKGKKENYKFYHGLNSFIYSHDLSVKTNYDSLMNIVDVVNFTDYIIANIYAVNTDWPYNNEILWRYCGTPGIGMKDNRWRWILTDFDVGFGYKNPVDYSYDMLAELPGAGTAGILFGYLIQNDEYRHFFTERSRYHLDHTFHPDTVNRMISALEHIISPEMGDHITRWRKPVTLSDWKKNMEDLRIFTEKRWNYLKARFDNIPPPDPIGHHSLPMAMPEGEKFH